MGRGGGDVRMGPEVEERRTVWTLRFGNGKCRERFYKVTRSYDVPFIK